jgi:hypothetical protein
MFTSSIVLPGIYSTYRISHCGRSSSKYGPLTFWGSYYFRRPSSYATCLILPLGHHILRIKVNCPNWGRKRGAHGHENGPQQRELPGDFKRPQPSSTRPPSTTCGRCDYRDLNLRRRIVISLSGFIWNCKYVNIAYLVRGVKFPSRRQGRLVYIL